MNSNNKLTIFLGVVKSNDGYMDTFFDEFKTTLLRSRENDSAVNFLRNLITYKKISHLRLPKPCLNASN